MVPQRGKTQSPAQTRVKSLKQSIISFPCSHNCCSVFQNPGFKNHRLLHGAGNWNRTPQQHGQQQDSAAHMPSTAWVSGSPSRVLLLTLPTGSQRNHTTVHCASREADRKTLLLFISSEHGGGPEGKQKGHKRRCLKVSSPSILPPPDSELSLLTETVSKRKFQPK